MSSRQLQVEKARAELELATANFELLERLANSDAEAPTFDELLRELGRASLAYDELMQRFASKSGYHEALAAVQAHPDYPKADR